MGAAMNRNNWSFKRRAGATWIQIGDWPGYWRHLQNIVGWKHVHQTCFLADVGFKVRRA